MSGQLSLFGDLEVRPLENAPEELVMAPVESVPLSVTGPELTVNQNACEGSSFLHRSANLDEEGERASATTLGITEGLPLPTPFVTPEDRFETILDAYWTNSQDLAYSIVNIALPEDDESLFEDFASYEKACRLADTGHGSRPGADERFDRLAWCLGKMAFSRIEHDRGKVVRIETTVLDVALDLSFDDDELAELRQFGVRGASGEHTAFSEQPRLVSAPIPELLSLRTKRLASAGRRLFDSVALPIGENIPGGTFEVQVDLEPETATECGMIVSNELGDRVTIGYEVTGQRVFVDRGRSGLTHFSPDFPGCHGTPPYSAPQLPGSKAIALHVFVDRASVELFVNDGHVVVTEQVFPRSPYSRLELYCKGGQAQIAHCECWELKPAHSFDRGVLPLQTDRRMT